MRTTLQLNTKLNTTEKTFESHTILEFSLTICERKKGRREKLAGILLNAHVVCMSQTALHKTEQYKPRNGSEIVRRNTRAKRVVISHC